MSQTRTELAERALAYARREDALDAAMHSCRICGSRPKRITIGPDISMHSGWAIIRCQGCGVELRDDPGRNETCETSAQRVYGRWQVFNAPADVAILEALRRPTDAMIEAALDVTRANGSPMSKGPADVWQAMIDAALKGRRP